jgi:two-component system, cell cycle sensor histidine kinase and response regulator CckA
MQDVQSSKPISGNAPSHLDLRTLLLAQKTELIGELTRAIANQFNNTMMAITGYAELELKRLPPTERRSIEQVLSNTARATGLVQKLLGISRNLPSSSQVLDLNAVLTEIGPLVEQLVGERISVAYALQSDLPTICSDPAQIEQVLLSLAINARNAMSNGGKLTFITKLADLTKDSAREREQSGKYVMLAVDDTGAARPVEASDFELPPDADQDARINLSLAAVNAIVKEAKGIARFASEPAKGSSFRIYFPALRPDAPAEKERNAPRNVPVARTVLIVEDDDAVRVPTAELLKMEGFKVLQARTGEEAILVALQNRSPLDVLITDVVMPKMTGHEVAQKLLEMNPELKVLFISGEDVSTANSRGKGTSAGLRKPFRLEALKEKIHDLLDE